MHYKIQHIHDKIQHIHDKILYKMWHIILPYVNNKSYPLVFYRNQQKLLRICHYYLKFNEIDFIGILSYVERFASCGHHTYVTCDNKHYLLLMIVILYSKMYQDYNYENSYYAKLTKTQINVLNQLELSMLVDYHQSSSLIISETNFNNINQEIDLEIKNNKVYYLPDTQDDQDDQDGHNNKKEVRYTRWKPQ